MEKQSTRKPIARKATKKPGKNKPARTTQHQPAATQHDLISTTKTARRQANGNLATAQAVEKSELSSLFRNVMAQYEGLKKLSDEQRAKKMSAMLKKDPQQAVEFVKPLFSFGICFKRDVYPIFAPMLEVFWNYFRKGPKQGQITATQVAAQLGVSVRWIQRLLKDAGAQAEPAGKSNATTAQAAAKQKADGDPGVDAPPTTVSRDTATEVQPATSQSDLSTRGGSLPPKKAAKSVQSQDPDQHAGYLPFAPGEYKRLAQVQSKDKGSFRDVVRWRVQLCHPGIRCGDWAA